MVFSSLQFIFIFVPVFFCIYYLVPGKVKNLILLMGSLAFYLTGALKNPEHLVLLLLSILLDFMLGLLMESRPKHKKAFLSIGIIFHLICLCFFKYFNFIAGELNRLPGVDITANIVLPLGISFYTFQGISYIIDVYRGKIEAEDSLLKFSVYISMFEQLIAGPIVTYDRIKPELDERTISKQDVKEGIGVFIFGLGLKVLLANPLGKMFTQTQNIGFESITTPLAWMAAIAFSLQLYLDFFGYSLMAQGLGKMLGFNIPQNFNFPYISRSMTEFWRRWHITLGSWFREYLYIPLGGNRKGTACTIRNLLIVWLFTGAWHGAGYNFLLWGLILFVLIAAEKFFLGGFLDRHKVFSRVYMLLLIPLTWSVFAITDIRQLGIFFTRLFPFLKPGFVPLFPGDYLKYLGMYYPFFIIGILFSTKLPFNILKRIKNKYIIRLILLAILLGSVYCMYRGFDDPFLYFRF